MSFNRYFESELKFLRELGLEFAANNPALAPFLQSSSEDPDVARLFEGVAFLTGRIRQKLDDEIPEIIHSLIHLLLPNYLNPIPSMSILAFNTRPQPLVVKRQIEQGLVVNSIKKSDTQCQFRTCYPVDLYPIDLVDVEFESYTKQAMLDLKFELINGAGSDAVGFETIRLYLHCGDDLSKAQLLYLWLFNYLDHVEINTTNSGTSNIQSHRLSANQIKPVGYGDDAALLPNTEKAFSGFRVLLEYFVFPKKFMFFDITDLQEILGRSTISSFRVKFHFNRPFDNNLLLDRDDFRLFCTPIVNLFQRDMTPIEISDHQQDYLVRPEGIAQQTEIFTVDRVFSRDKNQGMIEYPAFESFTHELLQSRQRFQCFYKITHKPGVTNDSLDHHISFIDGEDVQQVPQQRKISASLTCTNKKLAQQLLIGEINQPYQGQPAGVSFRNISMVTDSLMPPVEQGLAWRLISALALNYNSYNEIETLKSHIQLFDLPSLNGKREVAATNARLLAGIQSIQVEGVDRLHRGRLIRAKQTYIKLKEDQFGSEGWLGEAIMYHFACVLRYYFNQFAEVNSFHHLVVEGVGNGTIYRWEPQRWEV